MKHVQFFLFLVLSLSASMPARSAASLAGLMDQVPAPPASPAAAAGWVREGRIVEPSFVAFEARLQAEKSALAAGRGGAADTPAVQAARRGYEAYRASLSGEAGPDALLAKRTAWIVKRFDGLRQRPQPAQPIGQHTPAGDELETWRALFRDWQQQRRPWLVRGDRELAAAGDAAVLADYRRALLQEVETLLSISRTAALRTASAAP